ncbi:membrane protein [Capnocytophaga catalasegens]|uniref:Membrane protein n=2 Tax=Capnocytophaga catalasegens TaxID=1004260 RepID=A0AAV5B0T1_9FLAO|nr:membrane protein [Capnocytophaga catalasegens]GJM51052.1 membrane protein [Capnocytophaga catalasegens]GJM52237.1 membrane protein [Capnocytophaga catalasegens]
MIYSENVWQLSGWTGYVKAFAEAAMVGALADWFAVTALFHYPLGIQIPHTNLIENRKKDIADNLGHFVVDNFLSTSTIRPYIYRIEVTKNIANWFLIDKNKQRVSDEIRKIIVSYLLSTNDKAITRFLSEKISDFTPKIPANKLLSQAIFYLYEHRWQDKILTYLLNQIDKYLAQNKHLIQDKVQFALLPDFVNALLSQKITEGLQDFITEIIQNPTHAIRKEIDQKIVSFTKELSYSPQWEQSLSELKNQWLSKENLQPHITNLWFFIKTQLLEDLEKQQNSNIDIFLNKNIDKLASSLANDFSKQQQIDRWIQKNIYQFVLRNKSQINTLISNTIGNWHGRELSEKLELEVGKDLQFIRINGTLVGGLVGLIIYILTRLIF